MIFSLHFTEKFDYGKTDWSSGLVAVNDRTFDCTDF